MNDEFVFTDTEALGMSKKKTIYVYRNEAAVRAAVSAQKAVAGFVVINGSGTGEKKFEFQVVARKPVKEFVRFPVQFDDSKGLKFHGLWCAPMAIGGELEPICHSFQDIQGMAKMAAVAIPLRYIVEKEKSKSPHPLSAKYCVITNWWRYRMKDGGYRLPRLEPSLYYTEAQNEEEMDLELELMECTRTDPNDNNNITSIRI
jgi:hypothetical protein